MTRSYDEITEIFLHPLSASSKDFIIFPINDHRSASAGGTHWSLGAYSRPDNCFYHLDSFDACNFSSFSKIVKIFKACLNCDNASVVEVDCLQQNNSYDCGIFVLCHADLLCHMILRKGSLSSLAGMPPKKVAPQKVAFKRQEVLDIIEHLKGSPLD